MKLDVARSYSALAALFVALPYQTQAQTVPPLINYQAQLQSQDGAPVATGDYVLQFSVWDAPSGGSMVWGPQTFNGQSGPGYGPKIPVVQGWCNVMLGPVDQTARELINAFGSANRFVEVQVGNAAPVAPRQQLLSVPYALTSLRANDSQNLQGHPWSAFFSSSDPATAKARRALVADTTVGLGGLTWTNFFTTADPSTAKARAALVADRALAVEGLATTGSIGLFVSTDGNDANDGLAATRPKRTIQAAIDAIPALLRHVVDVQVQPGIYREEVKIYGRKSESLNAEIRIRGVGTTPADTQISAADASGASVRPTCVHISSGTSRVFLQRLTLRDAGPSGAGLRVSDRSNAYLDACNLVNNKGYGAAYEASAGYIENCEVRVDGGGGSTGLRADTFAFVTLRHDQNPSGPKNVIRGYNTGIAIYGGSIVHRSAPVEIIGAANQVELGIGGATYP